MSCGKWLTTLHFDMNKLRKSALPGTSFSLLPSPPSNTALADLPTPHEPYNHLQFSPDMMCLTSLNFLGIYCEPDAFLRSVLLLVRRCGSVRLPCGFSRRVKALGASEAVCSPNLSLFLVCRKHKDLQRCQLAGLQLLPCLPNILWTCVLKTYTHSLSFAHSMTSSNCLICRTLRDKIQGSSIWLKNETFIRTMAVQFWSVLAACFIWALLLDVWDSRAQTLCCRGNSQDV